MAWRFWASKGFFQTRFVVLGVGRDGKLRPTETFLRRLVSGGSGAASPGRNRPDITFQGASFEARHAGLETAVPSRLDQMGRFAYEINARVRRARESKGVGASNFSPGGEWATVALSPAWPSS